MLVFSELTFMPFLAAFLTTCLNTFWVKTACFDLCASPRTGRTAQFSVFTASCCRLSSTYLSTLTGRCFH